MFLRHENEYPSRPCKSRSGGPEPAHKYRIPMSSTVTRHSCAPASRARWAGGTRLVAKRPLIFSCCTGQPKHGRVPLTGGIASVASVGEFFRTPHFYCEAAAVTDCRLQNADCRMTAAPSEHSICKLQFKRPV